VCGSKSSSYANAIVDPPASSVITKDAGGLEPWFDIASVENTAFVLPGTSECPPTYFKYTSKNNDDPWDNHEDNFFVDASNAQPVTAGTTQFRVTPTDSLNPSQRTFYLAVQMERGPYQDSWTGYFKYTLILICGPTTPAVSFVQETSFATSHTLELIVGSAN